MNKKGFTLIELLAVIIILGILMLIAIPSVTGYINNSRKETYVSTIKELIKGASNLVNEGKVDIYDKNTTYYIPVSAIELESGKAQSPFGDIDEAYVAVTYDGEEYEYYYVGKDKANAGIESLKKEENITYKDIDTDVDDIDNEVGVDNRKYVKVFNEDLKSFEKSVEASTNIDSEDGKTFKIICKRATVLDEMLCDMPACKNAGYRDQERIPVGNLGTEGTYNLGDAFDCDVSGEYVFWNVRRRFYYLYSNNEDAILIFHSYVHINGTEYAFSRASYYNPEENWHGPVGVLDDLPSTTAWKNVSLKNTYRQIYNEIGGTTTKTHYLPVFDYTDKAARLLTLEELQDVCDLPKDDPFSGSLLDKCLFLLQKTPFHLYQGFDYWIENSYSGDDKSALFVDGRQTTVSYRGTYINGIGVKPVIEVPLNKIEQ